MLHIDVICIGKIKEQYLKEAISEYTKRLSKYCSLNILELPDEPIPNHLNDKLCENIKEYAKKQFRQACTILLIWGACIIICSI